MLKRWTWLILLMLALAALVGCSDDDDDDPIVPQSTPFETLAAAGQAYINDNTQCPGIIDADLLNDNLDDYTVIDVRAEADYLNGHIPGAYNSTFAALATNLSSGAIPAGKPYVVACYSGQSAGLAKFSMEMLGYDDVSSLKWGMSSWNTTLSGPMNNNINNLLTDPETTNNNAALTEHPFPDLSAYTNANVVTERVNAILAGGFRSKTYASIRDNLDDYFILNYHNLADYEGTGSNGVPGHIPGAFQFTPYASLGIDQMLKYLPTDMPIAVYCWTGQHSSQVAMYLTALGYDAYNLQFGANALYHDELVDGFASKWGPTQQNDYLLEAGPAPTPAFETIAALGTDYINDNADFPGVIDADLLHDNLDDYTVIDVRSLADYNLGHIEGAYFSSLATLLTDVGGTIPTNKPMVVVCYTGQTAGHAKVALEMMGYEDVKSLKWGMASWNTTLSGPMNNNIGDLLTNPETTNNNAQLTWHAYPTLAPEQPATVVANRVAAMLAGGFKAKSYAEIRDNLNDYFVLNYHSLADYEGNGTSGVPGHIPGAFQFTPFQSLGLGQMLAKLPTDKPIVVYCWTGQQSSQLAAYLNMLGYEAYSLRFGANALYHTSLTANKWGPSQQNDYPLFSNRVLAAR